MFMLSCSEVIYEQENNKNKIHIYDYDKQNIFNYFSPNPSPLTASGIIDQMCWRNTRWS